EPDHAQPFEHFVGRAGRGAVDAHLAPGRFAVTGGSRADLDLPQRTFDTRMDGKAVGGTGTRDVFMRGAAQATPRRQEGDGFEEIGLAGAVFAGEDDRAGPEIERQTA